METCISRFSTRFPPGMDIPNIIEEDILKIKPSWITPVRASVSTNNDLFALLQNIRGGQPLLR
jgi:hypothetical protein